MRSTSTATLVLMVGLIGCSKQEPAASNGPPSSGGDDSGAGPSVCRLEKVLNKALLKIAVIPMGTTHEFWKSIHAGAVKAERELGDVAIDWKGPVREDDRTEQINVVQSFITRGVDGIILAPMDDTALVGPIREAKAAGVGVAIMDSGIKAVACADYASFIATDGYVGGQKGARRLGEVMGGKGKALLLRYQVGSASADLREKGFMDVISREFPGIQMVSSDQYGGATSETAQNKADSLLQRYAELDGIFCPNESTTFGMLRALEESGRAGKIKFVGFDSSPKLIAGLKEGKIHGLVLQDPVQIGYLGVKTLYAYLRGQEVPTRIDTGVHMATPDNLGDPKIQALLSPVQE